MSGDATHWDQVYRTKGLDEVSWYQGEPEVSLRLIDEYAESQGAAVDVGAGRSLLTIRLLERGWHPVTAVDISATALAELAAQAPPGAHLRCVTSDVLAWQPEEPVMLWHDRAVFHFLTSAEDQQSYVELASCTVRVGGLLVLGCFAADGPTQCSGLDVCRYDPEALQQRFLRDFSPVHQVREEHQTPWGAIQPFTWVVMRRRG